MLRVHHVLRIGVFLLIALAWLASGAPPVVAAEAIVTDVRVGEHPGMTRFVIDLTRRVDFRISTLADPYRVIIDLPEVGWRLPARPLPRRTGLLEKFRYGLFKAGTSRLVLDVRGPTRVASAFLMEPTAGRKFRLVLDLARSTRAAFLREVKRARAMVASVKPRPASKPKLAAKLAALPMRPPPAKSRGTRAPRVIVLDPGHGGVDPGTVGRSGTYEKHVTLAVARAIRQAFAASGRYKVLLTRDRDVFVRLRSRVARARKAGADLFISIHADSIKDRGVRGLSVYTLSEQASDREAAALAEKENKADLIAGVNLTYESQEVTNILIDLAQRESMNQSARFAAGLVKELKREVRLLKNSHRFAGFAVLKAPDVPSILLELGFLSNSKDERALRSKAYRMKLADAIMRAADSYFIGIEEANRK